MAKRLKSKQLKDLAFVSDPQIDPSGEVAAAVVTRIEQSDDDPPSYRSRIRLYHIETGAGRDFTRGRWSDTMPRFAPRGRHLAYLSQRERDAKPQLQIIGLDGGEGRDLTGHLAGVTYFCWHPDGERIAYLTRGDRRDEVGERGGGRRIVSPRYKLDGVGFLPAGVTELRVVDVDGGEDRLLDSFDPAPTEIRYGPDGRLFVVGTDPGDPRSDVDRRFAQIWRYSARGKRGKGLLRRTDLIAGLSPAPDGGRVAFLAPASPRDFTSPTGLWTVAASGGRPKLLSGDFCAAPSVSGDGRYGRYDNAPVWSEDGGSLTVTLNQEGRSGPARIRLDGARGPVDEQDRAVTAFAGAAGRLVFVAETPDAPGELFVRFANGRERRLSDENARFRDRHALRGLEGPFPAYGDDLPVRYWSVSPQRPRKDRARVVQVHGGPHANYGYGFMFEFQLLAARGYRVVFGNPRGSSSFGSSFAQAALGAYGSVDADDVLAICDDAEARFGAAPVHLTGGSYGGFMTNWLVGHDHRFTSAVTQRSICNWLSFYGSSDIGFYFTEREVGGLPWESLERLWDQSPLKYVANVTTPLLILHAEEDHRCPIEQAEQLFVALHELGRAETELVRFPGEGHELSRSGRPDRRIERLDAIVDWFERHPE